MSTYHHPGSHTEHRPDALPTGLSLDACVRTTLLRDDRVRLADAVAALIAGAETLPRPTAGSGPVLCEQIQLARAVLVDVEHILRGVASLDPRGVRRVGGLLADVRRGDLSPFDPLALDDAARDARRLLGAGSGRCAAASPAPHASLQDLDTDRPLLHTDPATRIAS